MQFIQYISLACREVRWQILVCQRRKMLKYMKYLYSYILKPHHSCQGERERIVMLYKHWSDVVCSDCYYTAVCSPVLFPHRCHRAADRAGLSNYQDLLDILHLTIILPLKKSRNDSSMNDSVRCWWCYTGGGILTFIFGSDQYLTITLFLISQGPLEPVTELNKISTDQLSRGGCFLHNQDHILYLYTLQSSMYSPTYEIISVVRLTWPDNKGRVHLIRLGKSLD